MSIDTQRDNVTPNGRRNGHANGHATRRHIDIPRIATEALRHTERLVRAWLPKGRLEGREWVALNPRRADTKPGSFKVNLDTGLWCDFAMTDASGGDLVALRAWLDGVSQLEAAFLISEEIGGGAGGKTTGMSAKATPRAEAASRAPGTKGGPVIPAPREASTEELRHSKRGLPSSVWPYYAADGALHHMKARYDQPDGGKAFCYWHWTGTVWDYGAPATPFPLYNIADLIERIEAPVLIVEGEKAADAAATLFPGYAVVTSGGDNSASDADWTGLAGRRVVIWPDHDKPGMRYADSVATLAAETGAESVAVVAVPDAWPEKWDLADAPPEGVTVETLVEMLDKAEPRWPLAAFGNAVQEAVETLPLMRDAVLPQPYPMDDLGPFLAPVARAIARQVKVPEAMAGTCVLSIAALAAQGLADVELPVGGGLRSPLSLYFMSVAKSGARKSTAEKKANKGAVEWQKAAMKDYRVKLRAYKAAVKDHEAGRKSAGKTGDGFYEPEPVEPVSPRLLVSDVTAESVVKLLGANNRPSIGLFTGEGGKFTSGYAMSDKAKGYSAAVFNTLWDDGSVDRNRATDEIGSINLYGRRLSMHVLVQPDLAAAFLSDRALKDQGFLARFLICQPESLIGTRVIRDEDEASVAEDQAVIDGFAAKIQSLLGDPLPTSVDEDGVPNLELEPRLLVMSKEARILYVAFCNEVEVQAGDGGVFGSISGFACKAAEHAGRIAGVLAIAADRAAKAIGRDDIARAINLVRFHLGEAARLQGFAPVDPDLTDAEVLLEKLRQRVSSKNWIEGKFSVRDVVRLDIPQVRTSRDAKRLLATLDEHGLVRAVAEKGVNGQRMNRWRLTETPDKSDKSQKCT